MKHRTDEITHRLGGGRFQIRFLPNETFYRFEGLIDGRRHALGPTPESVRTSLLCRALTFGVVQNLCG